MRNKKFKILVVLLFIGLPVIFFQQSRRFYCISDERCVTVWKRIGGVCYIVPGKYYSLFKPSEGFIETKNWGDAMIYWPDTNSTRMIVRIEQDFKIINDKEAGVVIEDIFLDSLNNMNNALYNKQSKTFSDVNSWVELMSINIKESFAADKSGKKCRHD